MQSFKKSHDASNKSFYTIGRKLKNTSSDNAAQIVSS